ncbi:MAG TPA: cytochrome b/b6 domain-containing protein [Burkholderiaceae bacterium]|nr:cytochrome b/b6 domain-containing protein [Burkholderiaceae bacterium]
MNESSLHDIRVWDVPVRVFHWLMVLSFAGAWLTAESEHWRLLHITLGYTMAGLVAFRVVWGVVGTRHALFANFVPGPAAVWRYLRSLLHGRPEHHAGHNPAGAWAILALLALAALTTALGWATYSDIGDHWAEEGHEAVASLMLGVVAVHVGGVLLGSWLHRENLVRAMVTGRKAGDPADDSRHGARAVAALLVIAVLGFWLVQWQDAPASPQAHVATQSRGHGAEARERDD